MASAKHGRALRRQAEGGVADTGLGRLDQDRAGSLADEGGAAAAAVESQEPEVRARPGRADSVLCELSVLPLGGGGHLSDELAEVLAVIDASGLPYQLGPGGTCIEGAWDQVMPVVRACHEQARAHAGHVVTLIKIEDDEGQGDKIRRNVSAVEAKAKARRPLSRSGPPR
jgi:uncharacterized protein (TIGR00106 family)